MIGDGKSLERPDRSSEYARRVANIAAEPIELKKGEQHGSSAGRLADEWLAARKELLARRRIHPCARRVNAERRGLPMVKIDKDYVFEGPEAR